MLLSITFFMYVFVILCYPISYLIYISFLECNLCDAPHENHPRVMREAWLNKVLLLLYCRENIKSHRSAGETLMPFSRHH